MYCTKNNNLKKCIKIYAEKKNGYISKGEYISDLDEIIFVLIHCQYSFFNRVTKFQGTFKTKGNELYLTGQITAIYPNYIAELFSTPGKLIIIPFFVIGVFLPGNFAKECMILFFVFVIVSYIEPRITALGDKKKIIQELENI
jgi:hypothetical protein